MRCLSAGNVKHEYTSIFSPSGGICWSKNVCLVLTGTGRAPWVMFGQEPISPEQRVQKD